MMNYPTKNACQGWLYCMSRFNFKSKSEKLCAFRLDNVIKIYTFGSAHVKFGVWITAGQQPCFPAEREDQTNTCHGAREQAHLFHNLCGCFARRGRLRLSDIRLSWGNVPSGEERRERIVFPGSRHGSGITGPQSAVTPFYLGLYFPSSYFQ